LLCVYDIRTESETKNSVSVFDLLDVACISLLYGNDIRNRSETK